MVYISNFEALGQNFCPFAPNRKHIPAAIIAAGALAAAGAAASSVSNVSAQKSANETNLELTRMTNETNKEIARENNAISQGQFNTNLKWLQEQFYKQREFELANQAYENPVNVAQRLRAAGINPAFAIGQFPTGSASSSVSGVGAPSPSQLATGYSEAGHVDPIHYDFSGITDSIGHSVNAYAQNQLLNEQTESQSIDNSIKRATAAVEVSKRIQELRVARAKEAEILSNTHLTDKEREYRQSQLDRLDLEIDVFSAQMSALKQQPYVQNDMIREQRESIKWDIELKKIDAVIKPALANMQIRLSQSQMAVLAEQVNLVANEAKESYARGEKVTAEIIGQRIKNSLDNVVFQRENQKWNVRQGTYGTKALGAFSDYIGEVIFGGLKGLFK